MNEGNSLTTTFRFILLAFGILISPPLLVLLYLIPGTPVSLIGAVYLLSYLLIVIGLICVPWLAGRSRFFVLSGGILALAAVVFQFIFPRPGSQLNIMTMPDESGVRLLNRIFNERDAVLFGAQIGPYLGLISPAEKESLVSTFSQTYQDMNSHGATPLSPFLATYLGQQQMDRFDLVVAEPESESPPENGIIFLHGFGGNFTVQCWLLAKPGYRIDAVTVCPSTGVSGQWWNSQGQTILRETLTYLQQRDVERIYLAGLSNGAIGASKLADQFRAEIAGFILISGADPTATMTGLPVLVIHGEYDERIPVSMMEQYVDAAGDSATYHLFEGDHFLLLKQADRVQTVIADWLRKQQVNSHK